MLKTRVLTALVLVFLFGWLLFGASEQLWFYAILITTFLSAWEWSRFAEIKQQIYRLAYALMVVLFVSFFHQLFDFTALLVISVVAAFFMTYRVIKYQKTKGMLINKSLFFVLFSGVLVLTPFSVALILMKNEFEPLLILLSLMVVWAIDTGAYFSGRAFGRKKLAPFVSPGKTWEGVYGGFVLAFIIALSGLLLIQPQLSMNYLLLAVLLAFIGLYSIVGDLFESLMKRQVALKDSSNILPGHGGILDRLDSAILAVPLFYILWHEVL